jgi:PilZ domain
MLSASYWNGGTVVSARVRDISGTGAYLVTPERWYVGTMLTITFQYEAETSGTKSLEAITVLCKVARHDHEGMGIYFWVHGSRHRKELKRFLDRVPCHETPLPASDEASEVAIISATGNPIVETPSPLPAANDYSAGPLDTPEAPPAPESTFLTGSNGDLESERQPTALESPIDETNGSPSSTQSALPGDRVSQSAEVIENDGGNTLSAPDISKNKSQSLKMALTAIGVALTVFLGWLMFWGITKKEGLEVNRMKEAGAAAARAARPNILAFVGGKPISATAKRSNDIYVAIFMSVEAQYDNPPSIEDLDAIRDTLTKNGLNVFDTKAGGYALEKGSGTYRFGPSTRRSPSIVYLRPELEMTARKIRGLLRRWVAIPDQSVFFTDSEKLDNEGFNLSFKEFARVSGIDIQIEF